jgi:hypothetical protein
MGRIWMTQTGRRLDMNHALPTSNLGQVKFFFVAARRKGALSVRGVALFPA